MESYLQKVVYRNRRIPPRVIRDILKLSLADSLVELRNLYKPEEVKEEYLSNRAKNRALTIRNLLPKQMDVSMYLDFGGADGSISKEVGELFWLAGERILCADLTSWENMHHEESRNAGVVFVPLESEKIPVASGVVDLCTALQVFHHLPNLEESLRELYRILSPGGYLFVREHDSLSVQHREQFDMVHYLYEIVTAKVPNWEYMKHKADYRSAEEWIQLLSTVGFQLVAYEKARDQDINRVCHLVFQKGV